MATGALPDDKELIRKELDVLESSQTASGQFNNFGNFPKFRGDSESAQYFQAAFILISFLKFRDFTSKNYGDVIDKGFGFLNRNGDLKLLNKEALSVIAYAYALNGDNIQTQKILDEIEKVSVGKDNSRKCYKLSSSKASCDIAQTSYIALAYIKINKLNEAKPIVTWILNKYKLISTQNYNHDVAIMCEVIANFCIVKHKNKNTDFTVTFANEFDFHKILHISNANQKDSVEVIFPDYSLEGKISLTGTGYCSITRILEYTISVEQTSTKLNLKIINLTTSRNDEKIVRVCAVYEPKQDDLQTLFNVIYDVEIPSGYVYKEIVDQIRQPDIKVRKYYFLLELLEVCY